MLKFSGYSYLIWDQVNFYFFFPFKSRKIKTNLIFQNCLGYSFFTGKFYPILKKKSVFFNDFFWNKEFKVKQLVYRCKTLITIKNKNIFYENILLILKQTYFFSKLKKCNMRSKIRWFTYSAIHTTYRILLRSSSLREPRDPLSKVVFIL